ncbi:hypothetical protein [Pedobacter frigoris]|uniref:Uncharacterized protein n=1 Tax=Pedobacter frigoris TaxID=2571272 RepID=A0A4V5NZP7_9SPHI|nr:hypothetical protein [Pedobacter frigoris]TKC09402.1 hypothetical protein FA047_04730 [Pedobacter frigoris]
MIKSASFVMCNDEEVLISYHLQQPGEEFPDDSKEDKQVEFSLDDEISPGFEWIEQLRSSEKLNHFSFPETVKVHLSLPSPPPNILVG